MDIELALRLARLQERIRAATFHELKKDGHCKSSEGYVELALCLPPVVGDDRSPYWHVHVFSYILCPNGRTETWTGKTAAEAIAKAEDAIKDWCFMVEMEMFDVAMGNDHSDHEEEPPFPEPPAGNDLTPF